jgi:DNA-directed RNA polymerase specialized sigma subunit
MVSDQLCNLVTIPRSLLELIHYAYTQKEIANKIGCSQGGIARFKKR